MLFFLRKVRRKLMNENKISAYLLYAIGEILLVVVGILIAVKIDSLNQENQEKIKQTQKVEHRSAVVRRLVNPPGQHHSMNEQVCQPWHYTRSPDVVTLFQSNAVSHPGRVVPRMPRSISSRNEPYHDAHPLRVHW